MFGEYIKKKRLERGYSLRAFCRGHNQDPSNWSKLERGILAPPSDSERLAHIAVILGLSEAEKMEMLDKASVDSGRIPGDIMNDAYLVKQLPAFFRTIRNEVPNEKTLKQLGEAVKKEHTNA